MEILDLEIDEKVELTCADIFLLKNGLIHVVIKTEQEVTLDIAKIIAEARERLSGGIKRCVLYKTKSKIVIPSPEVRKFMASEERSKYVKANALVINSISQRLMANFFMKLNKPVVPSKFFDSEQAAIEWLLAQ